ncbi:MAG: TolC family protein, partial [Acidobacteria bacterium]|nr:TolC family protein [Candidatus Polarisedimenticola svalbardensis]
MNSSKKTLKILFIILMAWSAAAAGEPALQTDLLTVQEAVDIALSSHPELAAERERLTELKAQVREAWSAVLPVVDATASGVRSQNPGFLNSPNFDDFAGGFDPSFLQPVPVTLYDYGLSVEQTVYAFGKVSKAVQAARMEQARVGFEVRSRELEIARDAALACFELARAEARIAVLNSERESREVQVSQALDYLEVGTGTRLQYLQAKAALASLKSREIAARGEREIAALTLNRALGLDPGDPVRIDGNILSGDGLEDLPDRQRLLAAGNVRADLMALEKEREVLGRLRGIEKANHLPELNFNGNFGFQAIETSNLTDTNYQNWSAGIFLEWNLYDGGATRARVRQIDSRHARSLWGTADRRGQIAADLLAEMERYRSAREAITAAREAVV